MSHLIGMSFKFCCLSATEEEIEESIPKRPRLSSASHKPVTKVVCKLTFCSI